VGSWPAVDPAEQGPFTVVTENDVGPETGESDEGEPLAYTMFRPEELGQEGLCHPIVTWGNGTGANPGLYGAFLRHLASHGFVVIASDSPNVGSGDPPPMVAGVDWVIEQNADPSSVLYQQIDVTHVGATGHSQGGFATTQAAGDDSVTTIAPLCGAAGARNLHGPALLLCGGLDDIATCSGIEGTFEGISDQPAMFANYLTADHANWITFNGTNLSPMVLAVVAWMRVHLIADDALRSWFYGASCGLCTISEWAIRQSMMDE
jgi:dienelactone hydrolase